MNVRGTEGILKHTFVTVHITLLSLIFLLYFGQRYVFPHVRIISLIELDIFLTSQKPIAD